jgi:hypothetical protein
MSDIRLIKPGDGRRVRRPDGRGGLLSDAGERVEWNSFWQRRLQDGDVVYVDDPAPAEAAPPAAAAPAKLPPPPAPAPAKGPAPDAAAATTSGGAPDPSQKGGW